jgi:hypothetical protein
MLETSTHVRSRRRSIGPMGFLPLTSRLEGIPQESVACLPFLHAPSINPCGTLRPQGPYRMSAGKRRRVP